MENELIRKVAIFEEFETSIRLIRLGLGEIQNLNSDNDFYFLPFQLLQQGLERFMKMYILVWEYHQKGELPNKKFFRDLGHDIEGIMNYILSNHYFETMSIQILEDDKIYIQNDIELHCLLHILSEFGKMARYHNFEIIENNTHTFDPMAEWSEYESNIQKTRFSLDELYSMEKTNEIIQYTNAHIVSIFEKFIAALSRQFNYCELGLLGKQMSIYLTNLSELDERNYGKTNYRVQTTRYTYNYKNGHKRTLLDWGNRHLNPNYKYKEIKKEQFKGDWPFYADSVIIERRESHWYTITIKGKDFSLNGAAKSRYKLENPFDAGMAILGKSIQPFIDIAKNL